MQTSDWISLFSGLVSVASLVVAAFSYGSSKASAKAAQDSNILAVHTFRRDLFRAFQHLRNYIADNELVDEAGINERFAEAQSSAELYISKKLAEELKGLYLLCLKIPPHARQFHKYNESMLFWVRNKNEEKISEFKSLTVEHDTNRRIAVLDAETAFRVVEKRLIEELSIKDYIAREES